MCLWIIFSNMKSDFFSQKNKDFLNYFFWMKSIKKKKTGANFLLFVANCGKILFYILILIYFFKYETIVRFDVYACLDCNCWKRITVNWYIMVQWRKSKKEVQYWNSGKVLNECELISWKQALEVQTPSQAGFLGPSFLGSPTHNIM